MKIGELAARAGVTTKTVRYYESLGLLVPARLSNGYRDYGQHDVRAVQEVRSLSRLGIPVGRTRPFLECLAAGRAHADDCPASLVTYRNAITELTERIEALAAKRAALVAQLRGRTTLRDEEPHIRPISASTTATPTCPLSGRATG